MGGYMEKLVQQITKIMAEVMGVDPEKINENTSRTTLPEWDSFNHLLFISEVEKVLNVSFTVEEVAKTSSFKELCTLVSKKK